MEVKINGKWYDLTDFDSYEEIEELGEIEETKGIPNVVDLKADWDNVQEYLNLSEEEQKIMMAYFEVVDEFNWGSASEAYVGQYRNASEFAESLCEDIYYDALDQLPYFLRNCIDWRDVWDSALHYDYFESNGHYFRNL